MAAQPAIRSAVPGLVWPAIPSTLDAELLALQYQLEKSQWFSPDKLLELQLLQAKELLKHVLATVPYYQQQIPADLLQDDRDINLELWRSLPILQRADIQKFNDQLISAAIPPSHLPIQAGLTSGSTGRPLHSMKTRVSGLMWMGCALRAHVWYNNDLGAKLAVIKYFEDSKIRSPQGAQLSGWGQATDVLLPRGHTGLLDIRNSIQDQLQWLTEQQPDYLVSYPSNLATLAELSIAKSIPLKSLRSVSTLGEILLPRHRNLIRQAWGVETHDVYSAEEIGYIALQCPEGEHYHIQAEHVLLEVLDENGRACQPGQTGRVVITALNNFAKPLIRYEIGDYAEVGPLCACGRGLPVLTSIRGRQRNMLTKPNGDQFWPIGLSFYEHIAKIRQYQVVQIELDSLEVRLVVEEAVTAAQEDRLTEAFQADLGYAYKIRYVYFPDRIPTGGRGKFEDFISLLS